LPPLARARTLSLVLLLAGVLAAGGLIASGPAARGRDLQSRIDSRQAIAASLESEISAETSQLRTTGGNLQEARSRLATLQSRASAREAQLTAVRAKLLAARNHLVDLENRMATATHALAANLVSSYEGDQPDGLSVLLNAHGFADLLERLDFLRRVAHEDADVVTATRDARAAVARQAATLGTLEERTRQLTQSVLSERDQAGALEAALLRTWGNVLDRRASRTVQLRTVQAQLASLREREIQIQGESAPGINGIQLQSGGMVQPPPGAPPAVAQVIAAGNAIATLPYVWGGGHGSFSANGYDCSGSVSYALAAAGLVSSPMVSGDFESWGDPGPGRWITVYANAGHVFMYVAGWRFDTVALAEGGTRWSSSATGTGGYVARHPPGL
jgi:peptidoglycan hydrolase CwlO-like protein